jgi:hypothetical protein
LTVSGNRRACCIGQGDDQRSGCEQNSQSICLCSMSDLLVLFWVCHRRGRPGSMKPELCSSDPLRDLLTPDAFPVAATRTFCTFGGAVASERRSFVRASRSTIVYHTHSTNECPGACKLNSPWSGTQRKGGKMQSARQVRTLSFIFASNTEFFDVSKRTRTTD